MKKIFVTILAALCFCMAADAVPAYKGLIRYTQPDGSTIMIRLHGDEYFHWTTDAAGNYLEMDDEGYYRPASRATLNSRRAAGQARRYSANARRRSLAKASIATGQKRFLVILVEFSDVYFNSTKEDFENLLNKQGYNVNGGTGSARDFYYENSNHKFEPIFDVYGPTRMTNNRAYYGQNASGIQGNDQRPEVAVKQGCIALDGEIDFSKYDNDGDGEVDLVFMYYAGQGEADGGPANSIWPHQWELTSGGINLTLDGKRIDKYACTNEIVSYGELSGKLCGIGTACHEFGHAMGLPDFYDTDYDDYNGEAGGLYDYSTMCGGSYNNEGRTPPYFNMEERIMLGWVEESAYNEFNRSGNYNILSVKGDVAFKSPTDQDGEYFVYECRTKEGWDVGIPEAGMIVYHVDKSSRMVQINGRQQSAHDLWYNWEAYNSINENGNHPCFYVVPAGAQTNLNYSGSKFAFPGAANKTSYTAKSWNGVDSDVKLTNISFNDTKVTLTATVPSTTLNYNVIANPGNGVYQAGSSFNLALVESEAQPVASVEWYFDDEPVSGTSVTLPAGTHVVEAHLTLQNGATKILSLTLDAS